MNEFSKAMRELKACMEEEPVNTHAEKMQALKANEIAVKNCETAITSANSRIDLMIAKHEAECLETEARYDADSKIERRRFRIAAGIALGAGGVAVVSLVFAILSFFC